MGKKLPKQVTGGSAPPAREAVDASKSKGSGYWNPLLKKTGGAPGFVYHYMGMIYLAFETSKDFKEFINGGRVKMEKKIESWPREDAMRKFDELFDDPDRIEFLRKNIEKFVRAIMNVDLESYEPSNARFTNPDQPNFRVLLMVYLFIRQKQDASDVKDKKDLLRIIQEEGGKRLDEIIEAMIASIDYWQDNRKELLASA